MAIYKDVFTDNEMFSEDCKIELIDDIVYKVHAKRIIITAGIDESVIGGSDGIKTAMIDVLDAHNLEEECTISSKIEFRNEVKKYVNRLLDRVKESDAERARALRGPIQNFVAMLIDNYHQITVYTGKDDVELEGNLVFAKSHGEPGTGMPEEFDIYYFKDGVVKE